MTTSVCSIDLWSDKHRASVVFQETCTPTLLSAPHRNIKTLDVNAFTAGKHDSAMHGAPRLIAASVQHQLHLQLALLEPVYRQPSVW